MYAVCRRQNYELCELVFALSAKEEDIYLKKILDISRYIHDQIENLVIMKKYSSKSLEYTGKMYVLSRHGSHDAVLHSWV